jgi:hypothetical protein
MERIVARGFSRVTQGIAGVASAFRGYDSGDIRDNRDGTHSTFEEADMSS